MLGTFILVCFVVFLGMWQKTRRRGLKMANNVSIITLGGLDEECSDEFFDEDMPEGPGFVTPGAAGFVTPPFTTGNDMRTGDFFDEDMPEAAEFVTPPSTAGNVMRTAEMS